MTAGIETTGDGLVTFVNRFTVRSSPEEFERAFAATSEFMGRQPGFLRYTLLKHIETQGSYLNIAQWRSLESFRRAVSHPDFLPHATALRALSTSESDLYTARQTFAVDR